jgi:hypothetical protein
MNFVTFQVVSREIEYCGKAGWAFNMGSDRVASISELVELIVRLVSLNKPISIEKTAQLLNHRTRYIPSIVKAPLRVVLPYYSLAEALIRTSKGLLLCVKR